LTGSKKPFTHILYHAKSFPSRVNVILIKFEERKKIKIISKKMKIGIAKGKVLWYTIIVRKDKVNIGV